MKRFLAWLSDPAAVMNSLSVALCILLLAVVLTGCSPVPIRSEVPVGVKCVDEMPAKPAYRTKNLKADASDAEKVVAVALDWLDSRPYEAKLEAGLRACM